MLVRLTSSFRSLNSTSSGPSWGHRKKGTTAKGIFWVYSRLNLVRLTLLCGGLVGCGLADATPGFNILLAVFIQGVQAQYEVGGTTKILCLCPALSCLSQQPVSLVRSEL